MWRGVGLFLGFALGSLLALGCLMFLDHTFYGVWAPLAIPLALYFLLALAPRARPWRAGYSLFLGGGVLLGWLLSSDKLPWEKWDRVCIYAPDAAFLIALAGLAWWLAALARSKSRSGAFWLFLLAVCAWLIAYFSSGRGGAAPMEALIMRWFSLTPSAAHVATVVCRKSIHYSYYGCVGLFGLLAARKSGSSSPAVFALSVALLYSSFDEYRQSFFGNRGSSVYDVLLDMAGAATWIAIASLARSRGAAARAKPS